MHRKKAWRMLASALGLALSMPAFAQMVDTFAWDGPLPTTFNEAPMLAARVAAGELPPVEERLPIASDVLVVPVVEQIGEYGGTWRRGFAGPGDGQNADRIMMDHLLLYDIDGTNIVPNNVKDWSLEDDGVTYTFELRREMKWSDGMPFTADDFLWANEHIVCHETLNPEKQCRLGFSSFNPQVRKIDDSTIQWYFETPQAGFIDDVATYRVAGWTLNGRVGSPSFAPAHFLEQYHKDFVDADAIDRMVAAEGFENWETFFRNKIDVHKTVEAPTVAPWVVTSPNNTDLWAFERNPYYYGVDPVGNQLPYIDKIEMRLYESAEVHNLRAANGEYDFNHRSIAFNNVPTFIENSERGNYRLMLWPGDATVAVAFNYTYGLGGDDLTEEPDPEIRKWITDRDFKIAMSHAINRDKINELVYFGTATGRQAVFPHWHAHYPGDEVAYRYADHDPAKANAILDEIGLADRDADGFRMRTDGSGRRLTLDFSYSAGWFTTAGIMELLKEDWAAVGVNVNLRLVQGTAATDERGGNLQQLYLDGDVNAREPTSLISGRSAFPAYSNWYSQRSGSYTLGAVAVEPPESDTEFWRLVELSDESQLMRYADRTANYLETQEIAVDNLYYIGLIGDSAASNGVIVVKNNFRNVPERAPNVSALQNPGSGRTVQFFFDGGLNDAGF